MIWKKITQSFDEITNILATYALNSDDRLEKIMCVYTKDDSNLIYILNAFDFIDCDPSKDSIKTITLYQLID